MKAIYGYDPSKWKLGTLCIHGHAWPGTQQSLRRIHKTAPKCAACETTSKHWLAGFIVGVEGGELPAGHNLSKPCRRGHTYFDTGWCLRKGSKCVVCEADRLKIRNELDRTDPDRKARKQARDRRHRQLRGPELNARRRERIAACPDLRRRELARKRHYDHVRRSRLHASQLLNASPSMVAHRFNQFGYACAYCGSDQTLHIEHFIPISKGGAHVLSNILPACHRCNYSKSAHDPEAWYRAQPFFTEQRWLRILTVLGKRRAPVGQLALL